MQEVDGIILPKYKAVRPNRLSTENLSGEPTNDLLTSEPSVYTNTLGAVNSFLGLQVPYHIYFSVNNIEM